MYATWPYISVSQFKRSPILTLEWRNAQTLYEYKLPAALNWITYKTIVSLIWAAGLFCIQEGLIRAGGLLCKQVGAIAIVDLILYTMDL